MRMQKVNVSGKDAAEFLQRVTAGTVRKLEVGSGAAGALLTGQSRVIAQFDLLRVGEREFALFAPVGCAPALADGLEALHFSEELTVELSAEIYSFRRGESPSREGVFRISEDGSWPSAVAGFLAGRLEQGEAAAADWEFARIGAGYPWPTHDWDNNTPALEAALLPAIDRHKGCYPGQEVVELSLNVGHPVRLLLPFEGERSLVAGERVKFEKGEGQVCSVAKMGTKVRALIRLPWAAREMAPEGFQRLG